MERAAKVAAEKARSGEEGGENKDRGYRGFGTVHCDIFRS